MYRKYCTFQDTNSGVSLKWKREICPSEDRLIGYRDQCLVETLTLEDSGSVR
jgi:hypothetical protein